MLVGPGGRAFRWDCSLSTPLFRSTTLSQDVDRAAADAMVLALQAGPGNAGDRGGAAILALIVALRVATAWIEKLRKSD
jgi:hypothetical protein